MTEQQKDFVHMYLKHRDKIVAHNLAYGNNPNYDSVESSANRLLRIPEIAETIRSIQDNIRHEVEEEFKARYREELLSIYDKRMLLKKIATGEMYVEQKYKGKNCTQCSQYISPTINQMLAAIREDNKLAGHHPHKVAGKWVIPALQTEQDEEKDTSPLGRGWGGSTREEQEMQDENPQQKTTTDTSPVPVPQNCGRRGWGGSTPDGQETQYEKENKGQHPEETNTDNQPLTENRTDSISLPFRGIGGEYDTPLSLHSISEGGTINPSGNIISQEKLRELLYPQKPKLSYMKNNP